MDDFEVTYENFPTSTSLCTSVQALGINLDIFSLGHPHPKLVGVIKSRFHLSSITSLMRARSFFYEGLPNFLA